MDLLGSSLGCRQGIGAFAISEEIEAENFRHIERCAALIAEIDAILAIYHRLFGMEVFEDNRFTPRADRLVTRASAVESG
ncbi:hypothetical protein CPY51_06860 [Rhizobium tubonense]|uniref:Uncharacterized protein n=1 Tax=Rhizobium tubonense TaxID=484088 RepID=A0A2W4CXM2_9HYPH|nr:hypothetical protein CPY51_06860 [Rhizobium tubonense]